MGFRLIEGEEGMNGSSEMNDIHITYDGKPLATVKQPMIYKGELVTNDPYMVIQELLKLLDESNRLIVEVHRDDDGDITRIHIEKYE